MEPEVSAPISIDVEEAFDRDISDLDIPDYDGVGAIATKPAASDPDEPVGDEPEETAEEPKPKVAAKADPTTEGLDEKAKAVAAAKAAAGEPKKLAFKHGDTVAELAEDAIVEWKVDGKVTPVAVKDLLSNYSGKVVYEKRFNELANERKGFTELSRSFEAERERHKAAITDMHKAASEGRTLDAVAAMLRLTNTKQDPREYLKTFRGGLMKQAEELAKLTPEQRKNFEDSEEIAYLKSEHSQLAQQREREQASRAFDERVVKAVKFAESTNEEYVNTRDWLAANGQKLLGNEWDPSVHLAPEYIANQIRDVRDYKNARAALDEVDPELAKNETVWKQAVDFLRANRDWTANDLKDIYRQATQEKRSQAISKKVAKAPVGTTAKASVAKPKKSIREDFSVFDGSEKSWD